MTVSSTESLRSWLAQHARPQIVLWLGSDSAARHALDRATLARLPLVGVYQETTDNTAISLLSGEKRLDGLFPVPFATTDAASRWERTVLPVFLLNGSADVELAPRELKRLRDRCLEQLDNYFVHQHPLVLGLGLTPDDELPRVVAALREVEPDTPLVTIGPSSGSSVELATYAHFADATAFVAWMAVSGVGLEIRDSPELLYGTASIDLSPIIGDPQLSIDGVRLVTRQALAPPRNVNVGILFDALMRLDERRNAQSISTDLDEWHAIGSGLALRRSTEDQCVGEVHRALLAVGQEKLHESTVCWLPSQPASGATTLLHSIAHHFASLGFPVLVLKQETRSVDAQRLNNFLTELARAAGDKEQPALLVLDVQHAGNRNLEDLLDDLLRQRRQVVTLWAARLPFGTPVPEGAADLVGWHRKHLEALAVRFPRTGDRFLPVLRSAVDEAELRDLDRHVRWLKDDKGLELVGTGVETWRDAQRQDEFRDDLVPQLSADDRERASSWLKAEELFWPAIYHFLKHGLPRPSVADEMRTIAATDGPLALGVLLEVAKSSLWGLPVPYAALVNWVQRTFRQVGEKASPVRTSITPTSTPTLEPDLAAAIERLRLSWSKGRPRAATTPPSLDAQVRRWLDDWSDRGTLIRTGEFDGHVWVRTAHRVHARLLLANARQLPEVQDQAILAASLGDQEALVDRERAYTSLRDLLGKLEAGRRQIQFCETVAYELLAGNDYSPDWSSGAGEGRLRVFEEGIIPLALREQSRALLHQHALILRRTSFNTLLEVATRNQRLDRAAQTIERALQLPWLTGVHDEHPGHMRTTLGLVYRDQWRLTSNRKYQSRAVEALETAMVEVPDSRHTRLALAELLNDEADAFIGTGRVEDDEHVLAKTARVLELLSVEPTDVQRRWFSQKERAVARFDRDDVRARLDRLKARGNEDAFLLEAEILLVRGARGEAIASLRQVTAESLAFRNWRSSRRLAAILSDERPRTTALIGEQFRLLVSVEASAALDPLEEFHLAALEYMRGNYEQGRRRFAVLRNSGRSRRVPIRGDLWWTDNEGKPAQFIGDARIRPGDDPEFRSWMSVLNSDGVSPLFQVPYVARHFPTFTGREPIVITFMPKGPQARPIRFVRAFSREAAP